jgi:hypothetical protein
MWLKLTIAAGLAAAMSLTQTADIHAAIRGKQSHARHARESKTHRFALSRRQFASRAGDLRRGDSFGPTFGLLAKAARQSPEGQPIQ